MGSKYLGRITIPREPEDGTRPLLFNLPHLSLRSTVRHRECSSQFMIFLLLHSDLLSRFQNRN